MLFLQKYSISTLFMYSKEINNILVYNIDSLKINFVPCIKELYLQVNFARKTTLILRLFIIKNSILKFMNTFNRGF